MREVYVYLLAALAAVGFYAVLYAVLAIGTIAGF